PTTNAELRTKRPCMSSKRGALLRPECQRKPLRIAKRERPVATQPNYQIVFVPNRSNESLRAERLSYAHLNLAGGTGISVVGSIARERLGSRTGTHNRRDHELLARQMRHFQAPAGRGGVIMLVLAAAFVVGIAVGGVFSFANQQVQQPSDDGRTALAL